jgi:hypothetical protein
MVKSTVETSDVLMKILQEGTKKVIRKTVDDYMTEAKRELEDRIPEIMSTIVLQIWKNVSLERFGHELRITVNLKGGDKNDIG